MKPSCLSSLLCIQLVLFTRSSKNSSLSTVLSSHPADTLLIYCGTLCQLSFAVLKTVAHRGQIAYPNPHFCQNSRFTSFTSPILARPNLNLAKGSKVQAILLDKPMATWLTSLQRLSNFVTNSDLDKICYLFRLLFLLYYMTLRYLPVRRLMKLLLLLLLTVPISGLFLRKYGRMPVWREAILRWLVVWSPDKDQQCLDGFDVVSTATVDCETPDSSPRSHRSIRWLSGSHDVSHQNIPGTRFDAIHNRRQPSGLRRILSLSS